MYCIQCGEKLPEGGQYCPKCGSVVPESTPGESKPTGKTIQPAVKKKTEDSVDAKPLENISEAAEQYDRQAPPKVSWLTIFLAIVGLILVLVLLDPWHTGQEKPKDFQGTFNKSETLHFNKYAQDMPGRFLN